MLLTRFNNTHIIYTDNYTSNGLNQYTDVAGDTVSHDARGNTTDVGSDTFAFDARNRLTSSNGVGSTAGGDLEYDPSGRLYEEDPNSTSAKRFVYAGTQAIAEENAWGATLRRYVPGAGVDETLIWFEHIAWNNVERRFLLSDPRGSIVAVTDDMGAATSVNRYDEYGASHANNAGRFGFTGQMQLTDFGLWHYKARAYHSGLGRFLQTDPIGYGDGMNMYAYVGNDPVNMVDPTGLREKTQLANCRGQADCIVVVGERPSYSYGDFANSVYFSNNQGIDVSGIPDHIVVTAHRPSEKCTTNDNGKTDKPVTNIVNTSSRSLASAALGLANGASFGLYENLILQPLGFGSIEKKFCIWLWRSCFFCSR